MKKLLIVFILLLAGLATNAIASQPAAQASEQNPLENSMVVCATNGAPLTRLCPIQQNPQSNASVTLPVPQIGSTINVGGKSLKVTDVSYVYGSVSLYTIKIFVEPIE